MIFVAAFCCVVLLLFLVLRFGFLLPPTKGLPVLLYHKVSERVNDTITIAPSTFERHLQYLSHKGYQSISLRQLIENIEHAGTLPRKPVMITFDDGYVNNLDLAYPLLKKYGHKAVFFIPGAGIGKTNWWDIVKEPLLSSGQLKSLDENVVELGLHSFDHMHYGKISAEQIDADISKCIEALQAHAIPFVPALAYPYGGRPKDKSVYQGMVDSFTKAGIKLAFRIGNRVNRLPLKNPFEVKRISIRGTDSMWTFRTKLTKGRVKQV
jgi:peptidoglycan/xylan/chitin deacetylase (PgdA/CDA1 family)